MLPQPRVCALKQLIDLAHYDPNEENLKNVWKYYERFNVGSLHWFVSDNFTQKYQIIVLQKACDHCLGEIRRYDYYWDYCWSLEQ